MGDSVTQSKHSTLSDTARAIVKPQFDKTMHQPPRVDTFGYNVLPKMTLGDDGSNILK